MPLSPQAFSAPSKQMHGSNPKGNLNSIAYISASSTISIPSSEPSASKPRDSKLKREQNPRYRRHNGLIGRRKQAAPIAQEAEASCDLDGAACPISSQRTGSAEGLRAARFRVL